MQKCYAGGLQNLTRDYEYAVDTAALTDCSAKDAYDLTSASQLHQDLYSWLDFIIDENIPITACKKISYCKFSGTQTTFSYKKMKGVMQTLVRIREREVLDEMKKAGHGGIMHDVWTCAGLHYVALFACYVRTVRVVEDGNEKQKEQPAIHLLSRAPIEAAKDLSEFEEKEEEEIAAQFNVQCRTLCGSFRSYLQAFIQARHP